MSTGHLTGFMHAFNSTFFEFFDDILLLLPDNEHVLTGKNLFTKIKSANPSALIKAWYKFVYLPYHEEIAQGNVSFFFEKDYSQDLQKLKNPNQVLQIIDTIRDPLKTLSEENRAIVAQYVQNLTQLSFTYHLLHSATAATTATATSSS